MEFLLFVILASLIFGAGFIIAGLQIAFVLALFVGLFFGGTMLAIFLVSLSLFPVLMLAGLFMFAWWLGRNSRRPQIEPPRSIN
ncbi:MAG: hypothetical protein V4691_09520 [Pseudomonadota bacterium]